MKSRIFVAVILILLTSCEKGETDDTILKFFSEAYQDTGNSVAIGKDQQGNDLYYICGQFTDELSNNANKRAGVLKAGSDGNMIGSATLLGDMEGSAAKIIVLDNGDVVCTGYILNNATLVKDLFVCHLNSDLTIVNMKPYPDKNNNQYGVDIVKTSEGFIVLATTDAQKEPLGEVTGNPAGKKDILLMRIGNDLEPLSVIPAQGYNGDDVGAAVKADRGGGFITIGTTDRSEGSSGQAGTNLIIIRLNSDGSTTEPRIIGGTANEAVSDFEVMSDGYLVAGTTGSAGTTQIGYIWKIPLNIYDTLEYEHEIDIGQIPYSLRAMCRYKTNSFLLAGQHGTGLSARMLIFPVDVYGTPDAGRMKITGGTGTQIANDVITDDSDYIITVGSSSYENNSMVCFMKFRF